jgi:hypothetical protein
MRYRYLLNTRIVRIFQSPQPIQPLQCRGTNFEELWTPRLQNRCSYVDTMRFRSGIAESTSSLERALKASTFLGSVSPAAEPLLIGAELDGIRRSNKAERGGGWSRTRHELLILRMPESCQFPRLPSLRTIVQIAYKEFQELPERNQQNLPVRSSRRSEVFSNSYTSILKARLWRWGMIADDRTRLHTQRTLSCGSDNFRPGVRQS